MTDIRIKRIYEDAAESDGYRALVDRLWPRGVSKDRAQLDEWAKDLSPTDDMRKEFGHDEDAWPHFRKAYRQHLAAEAVLWLRVGDGNPYPPRQHLLPLLAVRGQSDPYCERIPAGKKQFAFEVRAQSLVSGLHCR